MLSCGDLANQLVELVRALLRRVGEPYWPLVPVLISSHGQPATQDPSCAGLTAVGLQADELRQDLLPQALCSGTPETGQCAAGWAARLSAHAVSLDSSS